MMCVRVDQRVRVLHFCVMNDRRQGALGKARAIVPLSVRIDTPGDDLGNPVSHQALGGMGPGIYPVDRGVPIELRDSTGVRFNLRCALLVHGDVDMWHRAVGSEQHMLAVRNEFLFDGLFVAWCTNEHKMR
jgi:hypothetical protein